MEHARITIKFITHKHHAMMANHFKIHPTSNKNYSPIRCPRYYMRLKYESKADITRPLPEPQYRCTRHVKKIIGERFIFLQGRTHLGFFLALLDLINIDRT